MDRVIAVCIRNPFKWEESREIKHFQSGLMVGDVLKDFYPTMPKEYDVVVSVNGQVLPNPFGRILGPGDTVLFCAMPQGDDGKDIFRAVALLSLVLAAPWAASQALAYSTSAITAAGLSYGTYTAAAIYYGALGATLIGGGYLISAIFPPQIPNRSQVGETESSPTYSWTPGTNAVIEGVVHPELFGTHRIVPPIIGWYIETSGERQYLNILLEVAGHEVSEIKSVRVNDNPEEYFEGVLTDTRLGTVNQQVIPAFNDTRTDIPDGRQLSWPDDWVDPAESGENYNLEDLVYHNDTIWESKQPNNAEEPSEGTYWTAGGGDLNWKVKRTTGNQVKGLGVMLGLPKGLFYANDSGGMDEQQVNIEIQFRQVGQVYSSSTTYNEGETVEYPADSEVYYRSLQDSNTNHTPPNATWWELSEWTPYKLYSTAETTVTETYWSAGYYGTASRWMEYIGIHDWDSGTTYDEGDIVEYPADSTTYYKSLQDSNTNRNPYTNPTWWESFTEPTLYETYLPAITEWDASWGESGEYVEVRPRIVWKQVTGGVVYTQGSLIGEYAVISGATTSPIHRGFYRDDLPYEGEWEIRCRPYEQFATGTRYSNDTYLESIQEIIYDDFRYPGTALLAVRALATDQLSGGRPKIDCIATRSTVPVYDGVSAYADKAANNPAWASYHVIHKARYKGSGSTTDPANYEVDGIPASQMIYSEFESWADWCDEQGYTVNVYFDQHASLSRVLSIIGANGRGMVTQVGRKYGCIVDRPEETPVQRFLFGMGDIETGSYSEEWLPMDGRADAVEVTYYDAAQEYQPQTILVPNPGFDSLDREPNVTQVNLIGCTDRSLAIKHGKFLMNCNRYLTLTASWGADVDAIACRRGDVVEISHDVPQFGFSGRVVSSSETSGPVYTDSGSDGALTDSASDGAYTESSGGPSITLDREVTLDAGTDYIIRVRHQDDDTMETYNCLQVSTQTTTSQVFIQTGYSRLPDTHANYAFGEIGQAFKEMRITSITRDGDMRRKITALEYVAEVYDDDATIPEPENISALPQVRRLKANEVWKGGASTFVTLSWEGFALYWNVYSRKSVTGNWKYHGMTFNPSFEISGLDYGVEYDFAVSPTENPMDGDTVSLILIGKTEPPDDVQFATATVESYGILIEWTRSFSFDTAGYELRIEDASYPGDWDQATLLVRTQSTAYRWSIQSAGTYVILICAYDVFNNYSENPKSTTATIIGPSAVSPTFVFSGQNVVMSWSESQWTLPVAEYEIRYGDDYSTSTLLDSTKALGYSIKVDWSGVRRFWITAVDISGNYGTSSPVDIDAVPPGIPLSLSASVIDNNVLLKWSAPSVGSLPIQYYEIRRGSSFASAEVIGQKQGTFTVVFESSSDTYTYWVVGIDTAGTYGTESSISATVSQPPDYVFLTKFTSNLGGTLSNAMSYQGSILMPVNTTETWAQHFSNRGWTTPADQIAAGYDYYIEPVPSTSYYEEVFDYGASITQPTMITLSAAYNVIHGSPSVTPKISVSSNGVDYTDHDNVWQYIESNFRYVKIRITVASIGGADFMTLDSLDVKFDLKERSDSGRVQVTDQGQVEYFNVAFLDVTSLTLTPEGTTPIFALYDFWDAPNPTAFEIYVYDKDGNYVDNTYVSWSAKGV